MVTQDEKLASVSRRKLAELSMDAAVRNVALYSQILLEQLGKEAAMEVIYKKRFDDSYKVGRRNAEQLGNPKDIATLAEHGDKGYDMPLVPPIEVIELTETRYHFRNEGCLMGEAILRLNLDPDLLDLVKLWCTHDFGRMAGWNPDIAFQRPKFMLDGDDCCEFLCELK